MVLRAVALLLALPVSLSSAVTAELASCGLAAVETRTVTAVIDGETLRIETGQDIRLAGIVAPRAMDTASDAPSWPPEDEAVAALTRLALGRSVTLHPATRAPDRHGRLVAHVSLENVALEKGRRIWLQAELLRGGHARAFGLAQDFLCADALLEHERVAEIARKGLWAHTAYQPRPAYRTRELIRLRSTLQIVTGRVRKITVTRNAIYLEFGRDWRQDFTAGVRTGRASAWTTEQQKWLKSLERQHVRVRGFIERRNGPYIEIGHPSEIEVLEAAEATSPTAALPVQPNRAASTETMSQSSARTDERPER